MLVGYNVPFDWLTFAFCLLNFAAVGVLSMFWHMPAYIEQGYMVIISALLVRVA